MMAGSLSFPRPKIELRATTHNSPIHTSHLPQWHHSTFHSRPRSGMLKGNDPNSQSLRNVTGSLPTPQPSHFAEGTPTTLEWSDLGFDAPDQSRSTRPKCQFNGAIFIIFVLPQKWKLGSKNFDIASHWCPQQPTSIPRAILKYWQRNLPSTLYMPNNAKKIHHPTLNIVPTVHTIPPKLLPDLLMVEVEILLQGGDPNHHRTHLPQPTSMLQLIGWY